MKRNHAAVLLGVLTMGACARPVEPPKPVGAKAHAARPVASASATAPAVAPPPPTASFGKRLIETACNGADDDGDGLVDVLLPVGPNGCSTGLPGVCAS